jgi:hypothetical protein
LLLLSLRVRLLLLKGLQHNLHQLVLVGNEFLNLRVGIVGLVVAVAALVVAVASLAIAVFPCVHHLRGF